jgi:hypothetical protein
MNSYHSIPTDFISNWQWMEVNAICFPMYWQGRLGHDAGQQNIEEKKNQKNLRRNRNKI